MHIAETRKFLLLVVIALTSEFGITAECDGIAVIYPNARFEVLSEDGLEKNDIGNLWWTGVRDVDTVVANSDTDHLAVLSTRYYSPSNSTNSPSSNTSSRAYLSVNEAKIGSALDAGSAWVSIPITSGDAFWADSYDNTKVLVAHRVEGDRMAADVYFAGPEEAPTSASLDANIGLRNLGCVSDGAAWLVAPKAIYSIRNGDSKGNVELGHAIRDGFVFTDVGTSCNVLAVRHGTELTGSSEFLLYDMVTGRYSEVWTMPRAATRVMISANKLLAQSVDLVEMGDNSVSIEPLPLLEVRDARSGEIISSEKISRPGTIGQDVCSSSERVVVPLMNGKELSLVSIEEMEVISSTSLVFDRGQVIPVRGSDSR